MNLGTMDEKQLSNTFTCLIIRFLPWPCHRELLRSRQGGGEGLECRLDILLARAPADEGRTDDGLAVQHGEGHTDMTTTQHALHVGFDLRSLQRFP